MPADAVPSTWVLSTRWTSPGWRTEVDGWILARLSDAHVTPDEPISPARLRPWSAQLTVRTDHGTYWFKENCPALDFEAGVLTEIDLIVPTAVVRPLAVDVDRGRLLSPDGGPTARTRAADATRWCDVMIDYATLQRTLADHGPRLAAAGLPIWEAADTAERVRGYVEWMASLPVTHPLHAEAALVRRTERGRARIDEAAAALTESPLPATVQHHDLQQDNVLDRDDGTTRIIDFGDALWSHPLCTLFVTRNKLAHGWACDVHDERVRRVVDAYLEVWSDLVPVPALRELVRPALMIGRWQRYGAWHRLLPHLPADQVRSRRGYFASLLDD